MTNATEVIRGHPQLSIEVGRKRFNEVFPEVTSKMCSKRTMEVRTTLFTSN